MTGRGTFAPNETVSLRKIAEMPLILPSMPNTLRSRLEHAFLKANLSFNLFGEASTSAILIPAVRARLASTVLPYSAAHEEICSQLVDMNAIEGGFGRDVYLCTSTSLPVSPATSTVIAQCHAAIQEMNATGAWKGCKLL